MSDRNKKFLRGFVFVALLLTPLLSGYAAEDYTLWNYSQKIFFDTKITGAYIPSRVENFPVLIRLNPSNFFNFDRVAAGGADIRFSKPDGTHLSYEIERWVDHVTAGNDNDSAAIWVKLDTVYGDRNSQYIVMYWGSPSTDSSNSRAVFDTGNSYLGVWHLGETVNNNPNGYADATQNAKNGQGNSMAMPAVTGMAGNAQEFDGTADYINLPPLGTRAERLTVSTWLYSDSWGDYNAIWCSDKWEANDLHYQFAGSNGTLRFSVSGNTPIDQNVAGVFSPGNWYHVASVYDSVAKSLKTYVNGNLVGTNSYTTSKRIDLSDSSNIASYKTSRYFNGRIDQLEISDTTRSEKWIKLCYENQRPDQTLLKIPMCDSVRFTTNLPASTQANLGATASFAVTMNGTDYEQFIWERSTNGTIWAPIAGAAGASYEFTATVADTNSYYRCIVSRCFFKDTSTVSKLTVCIPMNLQSYDPATISLLGDTATLIVIAQGSGLTYQWQRSANSGSTWNSISLATSSTYKFKTTASDTASAIQFRCIVGGACGATETSTPKTLCFKISVQSQPASDSVVAGDSVHFVVGATGTGLSYQWVRDDNYLMPSTTPRLDFVAARSDSGIHRYRCRISSTCSQRDSSSTVTLKVCAPPVITDSLSDIVAFVDSVATSTVSANGTGITYKWQRSTDSGIVWADIAGATGATLTFTVSAADTAKTTLFHCVVSGTCGSVTSRNIHVSQNCSAVLVTSIFPLDTEIQSGWKATFKVSATGTPPLSYRWQDSAKDATQWTNRSNDTSATLEFTTQYADSGARYRCIVSGTCIAGRIDTSAAALLRIWTRVGLAVDYPRDTIVKKGDSALFRVKATGTYPTWQWERSTNGKVTWGPVIGATDSVYRFKTSDSTPSGSYYRCVVRDKNGLDTMSREARLTAFVPPVIDKTKGPASIVDAWDSTSVRFSVRASGDSLTYRWERRTGITGSWTLIAGATDSAYGKIVDMSDNDARFRCVVSNVWNKGSDTSNEAILTVCIPVSIQHSTGDTGVVDGSSGRFIVVARGMDLQYSWEVKTQFDTTWSKTSFASDTSEFEKTTFRMGDNGLAVRCIVTGRCGADTTLPARLTVYSKTQAWFDIADSIGPKPFSVKFTDGSGGDISQWLWNFGDGTTEAGTAMGESVVHRYDSTGSFTVKLVVRGRGGADSLTKTVRVYNPQGSPIAITGRRITNDSVELTLSNYSELRDGLLDKPPLVDTVRIWNRQGDFPDTNALDNAVIRRFSLDSIKKAPVMRVKVSPASQNNPYQGFMTQIVWKDKRSTPFASENGCKVFMLDTAKQPNRIVLSGSYKPADTVTFFLDSVNSIDTSKVDSVGLWYGFKPDSVFRSGMGLKWWGSGTFVRGASGNRFTYAITDLRFNTDTKPLYVAVTQLGKNGVLSVPVVAPVSIGRTRPLNTLTGFTATSVNSATIALSWNRMSPADSVQRIRIWYRSDIPVPLTYAFDTTYKVIDSVGLLDTALSVFRLAKNTRYYFGAQVLRRGMWSVVTPSSSANDSTPAESRSTIINTLKVVSCVFDSATNALKVSWTIDTAGGLVLDSLEVGISYAPVEESQPDPVAIDSVLSLSDSATVIMAPLLFNRDYTMQMWVRKKNEEWAFPTAQSRDSVRTLPFTWQAVKYRFTEMGETVKWMNGKVSFATPPVPPANVKNYAFDTIRVFTPETGSSAGFVLAGPMFSFTGTKPSQPFTVGLKIDSLLLPAGRRPADARLYQYNPVLKRWVVRLAAVYDSVGKYRSLLTDSLGYAFAVMVDTLRPSIVALDTTDEAVEENTAVSNRVVVSDNVGNLTWRFLTAKGGEVFIMDRSRDSIMTKGIDTLTLTVDSKLVSDLNGVRIQVEADDGANRTTCDLSRRVVRQRSDQIVTPVLRWTPLRVTAQLDSPSVTRLLRFIDTSVAVPEYDKRHFRLYAWYPDASNAGETSKWVEYGTRPDSVFSGVPGRLLWVKTRAATLLHFGRGKTMSLKDTVRIVAKSKQWTDFALPYRFDITVGDILDATRHGADSLYADDLVIYRWDTTAGTYRCTPFFMADTSFAPGVGLNDRSKILSSNDAYAGYTVYNPSSSDIMMSFPPVSDLMSKYQSGFSKIAAGRGWVVKIVARLASGALLSPLYCGNKEGASGTVSFYPSAPSFDQVSVGVYDGRSGRVWGHVMEHGAAGGSSYLLTFRNDGDKAQEIRYTLSPSGLSPQAKMAVLDPATGTMTDAASSKPLTIQVDAGSSEYRWLIVGDMEYLASSGKRMAIGRLGLDGVYPNPVRNFATIRYTLPFGRVSRVEFLMLDIAGRTVSSAVVRERITLGGAREYQWKGRTGSGKRAAAGVYIVRMTAYDLKEHVIGSFDRRLTVLP